MVFQANYQNNKYCLSYKGNKINPKIDLLNFKNIEEGLMDDRLKRVKEEEMFFHINNIDNAIFNASIEYFNVI
jgi:hypothetical protein